MHKKIFPFFFMLLIAGACFSQGDRFFEINGFIENKANGKIFLQCYDEKGSITDQASDITDHKFYFRGRLTERAKASLAMGGGGVSDYFFLDTGKIDMRLRVDTQQINGNRVLHLSAAITGSKSQLIWEETVDHFGKISRCEAPDSVKSEDFYNAMLKIAKTYPELYVTRELLFYNDSWSYEQLNNLFSLIPKSKQETALGEKIKKWLALLKQTRANTYIFFPTQKDPQQKPVTLDDLEFTYLLIDFWASWCAPCRREHPGLVQLYNRYKQKGFNVLGISLDKEMDKAKWLQAIKEDQLPWKQVSDLKGFQTEIATHYALDYIPYNILIDRNGKILARDLRGDELQNKLRSLFEKKK